MNVEKKKVTHSGVYSESSEEDSLLERGVALNCIWWMDAAEAFEASVSVTEVGVADLGPF
jgi:hypothetical protein